MGIAGEFDDITEADIDAMMAADEMLAEVLKEFSKDWRRANQANRDVAGEWVPYTVTIDGRVVYEGRGQVWPENQISTILFGKTRRERQREANVEFGRAIKEMIVAWAWDKVRQRAVVAAARKAVYLLGTSVDPEYAGDALRIGHHLANLRSVGNDESTELDAIVWIAQELVGRSPVLTGEYRSSHTLFADGAEVGSAEDVVNGSEIPAASEYLFANGTPYATKLESGRTKDGGDFLTSVPNRIYEGVARDAVAMFGEVATIEFGMHDVRDLNRIASSPVITVRPR